MRATNGTTILSIRGGGAVRATDPAEADNTNWGEDRRWKAGSGYEGSDLPFVLLIEHGVDPVNASYLYGVVPGVNASDMKQLMLPLVSQVVSRAAVLRNDDHVQALATGGNANESLVQVVFRSSTSALLPLGDGGSSVKVSSDRPAVLMIARTRSHWNFSVAEVTRNAVAKTLTISIENVDVLQPGRYKYLLPVQCPWMVVGC